MRDLRAGLVAAVALCALLAAPVQADEGGRVVRGTIVGSTLAVGDVGVDAGPAHCSWLTLGEASQGALGHMVELAGAEGNGLHRFQISSYAPASFVVAFYDDLGVCGVTSPMAWGGWFGYIPARSTHALVLTRTWIGGPSQPCYTFPPLCQGSSYVSRPPASFTLSISR